MKTLNNAAFIHTSVMLRPYLVRRILQFNGVHLQLPNGSRAEGEGMDKNISVGFFCFFFTYISPSFQNVMKSVRKCLRRSVHRPL